MKSTLIFILTLIISVVLAPLRVDRTDILNTSDFHLSVLVGFIVIAAWTLYCLKKYSGQIKVSTLLMALFLGVSFLDIGFRLIRIHSFQYLLPTLIDLIIWNLGIVAGYLLWRCRTQTKLVGSIALTLLIGYCLSGPLYSHLTYNLKYVTVNGKEAERLTFPIAFESQENEPIALSAMKGKCVVLNCWDSATDSKEFAATQNLHNKVNENDAILIFSVFARKKNDTPEIGYKRLEAEGYTLPYLSISQGGYSAGALSLEKYPTVLILDESSNIIFRGDSEAALQEIDKLNNAQN